MYLDEHSRPDISYAVDCVVRFMFCTKHSHEFALKIISCYLKVKRDRGLVINPLPYLNIDCYPIDNISRIYGHENATGPEFVESRTSYAITVADLPVLW